MDAASAAVTTGVIVTIGRWSQGKGLEANVVIGGGVYAIMLGVLWNNSAGLASRIAELVLVSALLIYMVPIANKLGLLNGFNGKPTNPTRPT